MTTGGIRRAQLISPFGVGAMTVLVDGSSVLACGLDHWYVGQDVDIREFRLDEWRLASRLRVDHFRLPPDYRTPSGGANATNMKLTVPFLRFPTWSFCPYCKRLAQQPLAYQGRAHCSDPKHGSKGKGPAMAQVPFVVVCERGHLSDFPWREWVHRSLNPACGGTLRLRSQGGGSLAGQVVSCDGCSAPRRTLEGVTSSSSVDGDVKTVLSSQLSRDGEYDCEGWRSWLGDAAEPCGLTVRASLRGASNVYFPLVESSIFLPKEGESARQDVLDILNRPEFKGSLGVLNSIGALTPAAVRGMDLGDLLRPINDDADIQRALDELFVLEEDKVQLDIDEIPQTEWRRPEWKVLRGKLEHRDLVVTQPPAAYSQRLPKAIGRVRLVETLRETRALWGFTRVNSSELKLNEGKHRLWKQMPPYAREWLPAYEVRGEGIYLELDEGLLRAWEERPAVNARVRLIERRYAALQADRGLRDRELTPRLVLLHTLAHMVINQLVFECGYSSASLRERLYVASEMAQPMAGMLIYTAAGDSEGTMGGLVRMGKPGNLEGIWDGAFSAAQWCSTDPICMEAGEAGQGPDSCNLAACHACALLPETSCEEFNRFLDRALVVGSLADPTLGFFVGSPTIAGGR